MTLSNKQMVGCFSAMQLLLSAFDMRGEALCLHHSFKHTRIKENCADILEETATKTLLELGVLKAGEKVCIASPKLGCPDGYETTSPHLQLAIMRDDWKLETILEVVFG